MGAPDRIWVVKNASRGQSGHPTDMISVRGSVWTGDPTATAYIRLDAPELLGLIEALRLCQQELDEYSRQEYPLDHPVHEQYRQRDYESNPARMALAEWEKKL